MDKNTKIETDKKKKKKLILLIATAIILIVLSCVIFSEAITIFALEMTLTIIWVIIFIIFGCCLLALFLPFSLRLLQNANPEAYEEIISLFKNLVGSKTNKKTDNEDDTDYEKNIFQKIADFFKKVWNTPLIMTIISVVLLICMTVVYVLLSMGIYFLILELFCIVVGIIIAAAENWKRVSKILFISILAGVILTVFCFLLLNSNWGSSSNDDKCASCKGSGMINKGFADFVTCPTCRGSGLPPL